MIPIIFLHNDEIMEISLDRMADADKTRTGNLVNQIHEGGHFIYIAHGLNPDGTPAVFGITKTQISDFLQRGSYVPLFQLMKIVEPGIKLTKHIFRGLKRPLLCDDDSEADKKKLVYTWKAEFDYDWDYKKRFHLDDLTRRAAPHGRVFAVFVTPNGEKSRFPNIDYWLNRWTWIHEATDLGGAPINYSDRYDEKLK